MSLLKFILYSLIAYLVIRFVMRLISAPRRNQPQSDQNQNYNKTQTPSGPESLEKPKFTIEAESVDYEIIEESKDKDEK